MVSEKEKKLIEFKNINYPDNSIIEKHDYFTRDGKHLFYAMFLPEQKQDIGVVFCSPFAEEKVRTLRIFVSFARVLASMGLSVFCFDYFGDGDSEGDFEEASFGDRIEDIKAAVNFFKKEQALSKIGLLGLRWGGTLAALACEILAPKFLILWEPIVSSEKYFYDYLRSNIASQMVIEGKVKMTRNDLIKELETGGKVTVEGYVLNGDFYVKARQYNLTERKLNYRGKTLIVQISPNPTNVRPELKKLESSFSDAEVVMVVKEFEWEKTETWQPAPPQLFNITIGYLKKYAFFRRDI